jgi:hypothetical protein
MSCVEASRMPGTGALILTGAGREESAQPAMVVAASQRRPLATRTVLPWGQRCASSHAAEFGMAGHRPPDPR